MANNPSDDQISNSQPDSTCKENDVKDSRHQQDRRKFIQTAALGVAGLTTGAFDPLHAMANVASAARKSLPTIPAAPKFDHLVVLMMENRSFDHMLGRLYDPENPAPFDKAPRGQQFDGVLPAMSNPVDPAYSWLPPTIHVSRTTDYQTPPDDKVGHQFPDAEMQVGAPAISGHMQGFVNNRVLNLGAENKPPLSEVRAPMEGFSPTEYIQDGHGPFAAAGVLSTLANSFAVCDNWYSSIPGPTLVNRSFLHAATSNNWVSNDHNWELNQNLTVFNLLGNDEWKIYNGDGTTECLTYIIHPFIKWDPAKANSIAKFVEDAQDGVLPKYSFIEPEIIGYDNGNPPDDQHPPRDIRLGENLIATVYKAVRSSPQWSRTLLLVIYDEHGGFFDHRFPPAAVPPHPHEPAGEDGFRFDALGVRVPAVLISPLIEAGTVFHAPTPIDHTAVIKTLCNRFGLPSLTDRDANAFDLSVVLGDTARPLEDTPEISLWPVPASEMGDRPLNDLQWELLRAAAKKYNVALPAMTTTRQAKQFMRALSGASLNP